MKRIPPPLAALVSLIAGGLAIGQAAQIVNNHRFPSDSPWIAVPIGLAVTGGCMVILACLVLVTRTHRTAAFGIVAVGSVAAAMASAWALFKVNHGKFIFWNEPWTPIAALLAVIVTAACLWRHAEAARAPR